MAILNATEQAAANRTWRAIFYDALRTGKDDQWWLPLFSVFPTTTPKDTFHMLRGMPRMEEWLGDRKLKNLSEVSFDIEKKEWEASLSVSRDNIMFDRLNQVRPAIRSLAGSYAEHLLDYATDLLLNGFSTNAYDGQFFFDTDHDDGSGGSYSNDVNVVFSEANWEAAKTTSVKQVDPYSLRYLGVRFDTIVYGANSEAAVEDVFAPPTLAAGASNVHYNAIPKEKRIIAPELGNTGKWFLFDLSKPMKPLILMVVKGIEFVSLDRPTDWNVFNRKEYIYGVDSIDNAGYGLYEVAYGSTNAE